MAYLNENNSEGFYICGSCGHIEVHQRRTRKIKCLRCGKEGSWVLILSSDELEKTLKLELYKEMLETIKVRYKLSSEIIKNK